MVQSISQTQATKSLNGISYEQLNGNYQKTQPMKEDSFKGKTLLTLAAIAGAVVFRKQIGNVVKKYLPGVANFVSNKILTPIKNFSAAHKNNFVVKTLRKGQAMFLKAEKAVHKFFKKAPAVVSEKINQWKNPKKITYEVVGGLPQNINFSVKPNGNGPYSWAVSFPKDVL